MSQPSGFQTPRIALSNLDSTRKRISIWNYYSTPNHNRENSGGRIQGVDEDGFPPASGIFLSAKKPFARRISFQPDIHIGIEDEDHVDGLTRN